MNQIYLFAIASILATASLMVAGTFTTAAIAQISTMPSGDAGTGATMGTETSSNATGGNATSGTG